MSEEIDIDKLLDLEQPPKYYESLVKLSKARVIFLTEDFTKEVSAGLTALLFHYDREEPGTDISIYIHSDGGDASALSNIIDVMGMISSPVSTINLGKAYSAGAFLLAAGAKGKRFALKHSEVMCHGIQTIFPNPGGTDSTNSKSYLKFLTEVNDGVMKMLANHTGHSLEEVKKDCERDMYLSAKDALKYGIIDKIL